VARGSTLSASSNLEQPGEQVLLSRLPLRAICPSFRTQEVAGSSPASSTPKALRVRPGRLPSHPNALRGAKPDTVIIIRTGRLVLMDSDRAAARENRVVVDVEPGAEFVLAGEKTNCLVLRRSEIWHAGAHWRFVRWFKSLVSCWCRTDTLRDFRFFAIRPTQALTTCQSATSKSP
jgi:hypothetical protein